MKKTKPLFPLAAVLAALFLALPLPLMAQNSTGCVDTPNRGVICPPPSGGMIPDWGGNYVCGPGQCARDSKGDVRCSSQAGGNVTIDSSGDVLCVGGCVGATEGQCIKPSK